MEIDRVCNVCNEEASLFCRMCKQHCCWEHLCSHLAVAHEDNSYTQRLGDDFNENERSDEKRSLGIPRDNLETAQGTNLLPHDNRTIQSYSQAELQERYDYHRSQTRRIKAELERRALFDSGAIPNEHLSSAYYKEKLQRVQQRRKILPKSASSAVSLLSDRLRSGQVSVEYIQRELKRYLRE
jgi:hypothetical protein